VGRARRLLDRHPDIRGASVPAAAATADVDRLRGLVEGDQAAARREGGPFAWEPLLYLA
jgi:hypothetical protein